LLFIRINTWTRISSFQISSSLPQLLRRGEIVDYTEATNLVKRETLFSVFLSNAAKKLCPRAINNFLINPGHCQAAAEQAAAFRSSLPMRPTTSIRPTRPDVIEPDEMRNIAVGLPVLSDRIGLRPMTLSYSFLARLLCSSCNSSVTARSI